jgi:hypothetical protein
MRLKIFHQGRITKIARRGTTTIPRSLLMSKNKCGNVYGRVQSESWYLECMATRSGGGDTIIREVKLLSDISIFASPSRDSVPPAGMTQNQVAFSFHSLELPLPPQSILLSNMDQCHRQMNQSITSNLVPSQSLIGIPLRWCLEVS